MEKLKAKLLIYEPSLHRQLRYDCQSMMFILGLFPVGDFIEMCGSYFFFSFISSAVGKTMLSLSFWRSKCRQ